MMTVEEIFAEDRGNAPAERSLPWEEVRDGMTVVIEPKPHWATMRGPSGSMPANIATTPTGPGMAPAPGSTATSILPAMICC